MATRRTDDEKSLHLGTEARRSHRKRVAPSAAREFYLSEPCQGPGLTVQLKQGERLLERFTIKSCLGHGNASSVYLAEDTVRAQDVALKVVAVASDEIATRLRREINLHSRVTDYRHVLRIYDVYSTAYNGIVLLLISMEYADGGSLRQWLWQNEGNVCKRQTEGLFYFKQICRGVQALHEVGIVHLDLKPENLLFVEGVLKVSDLGHSQHRGDGQMSGPGEPQADSELPPGTPGYTSPERIMAAHPGDIDLRADIYSLGVVLYEICDPRCRQPFGGTRDQLRQRHLHVPAPALEMANANVVRVVATCLQKNPSDRYGSILELIDDLERGESEPPARISQAETQPPRAETVDARCQLGHGPTAAGNLHEASGLRDRMPDVSPADPKVQRLRDDADSRFQQTRALYATIAGGLGRQPLRELSRLIERAVATYPNHPDSGIVQERLLSAIREYTDVMDQGIAALQREEWDEARTHLGRAQRLNPGLPMFEGLMALMNEVPRQIGAARAHIDEAVEQGDRNTALAWARGIDRYIQQVKRSVRRRTR